MDEVSVLRLLASLALIVALILAGAWLTRRAGWLRPGMPQTVKIIGSQSLGGRAYVAVVQVEDARLVLGITAQNISLLHTLPPRQASDMLDEPVNLPGPGFAASLKQVLARRAM